MLGRTRLQIRPKGEQGVHIRVIGGNIAIGNHADLNAFFSSLQIYLVIHIGEIARIDHRILAIEAAQQAIEHIKSHHRAGIAYMGIVINGRPTDIERHPLAVARFKGTLVAGQGVVEHQGHGHHSKRSWGGVGLAKGHFKPI